MRLSMLCLAVAASLPLAAQTNCADYTGSTVDQRINACIKAAIQTGSGIADATAVTGTIAAQIDVGDHALHAVTLLLPKSGSWVSTINDGTSCALKQYSGSAVIGTNTGNPFSAGGSSQFSITTAGGLTTGPKALWCNENKAESAAGGTYIRTSGIAFFNTGLAPMKAAVLAEDWFDNSSMDYILAFDGRNSAMIVRGLCCGASLDHITLDGLHTSKAPPLKFENTTTQYNGSVTFDNLSVTHPGDGMPIISCTNNPQHFSGWDSIVIRDLYTETNKTDLATTMFQCDSAYTLLIDHWAALRQNQANNAYAISVTNNGAGYVHTQFILQDFAWIVGSGPNTKTIDDQINHVQLPSQNLGVSVLGGGIQRYAVPPQ